MSKFVLGLFAFLMLVVAPSVHADPIVITSGSLTVIGLGGTATYSISGQNFSATSFGGDSGNTPNCGPCLAGATTSLSTFLVGTSLGSGNATINGTTFNNIGFIGTFNIGASVVLPQGSTNITVMVPFNFLGDIRGCLPNNLVCTTEVFSTTQLVGSGIATALFTFSGFSQGGDTLYFFNRVTYEFQPAAVPEPMTLMLFASGLIGLGAKLKSRRRPRP